MRNRDRLDVEYPQVPGVICIEEGAQDDPLIGNVIGSDVFRIRHANAIRAAKTGPDAPQRLRRQKLAVRVDATGNARDLRTGDDSAGGQGKVRSRVRGTIGDDPVTRRLDPVEAARVELRGPFLSGPLPGMRHPVPEIDRIGLAR